MNQADAGDDLMRPALQPRQHPPRVGQVSRLAHDFAFEKNQRVRAEHERVGNFLGHGARLAMGVELAKLLRRQLFVNDFRRVAGRRFEIPVAIAATVPRGAATRRPG
jgi:hypothetical protein